MVDMEDELFGARGQDELFLGREAEERSLKRAIELHTGCSKRRRLQLHIEQMTEIIDGSDPRWDDVDEYSSLPCLLLFFSGAMPVELRCSLPCE